MKTVTPATWLEFGRMRILFLLGVGRPRDALVEGRATLAEQERAFSAEQPEVALTADALAEATSAAGLWRETIELTDRYLATKAKLGGSDTPRTGESLLRSARALLNLKRPAEAVPRAERALVALEKGRPDPSMRGEARRVLAEALRGSGGEEEVVARLFEQAREDAATSGDAALLKRLPLR